MKKGFTLIELLVLIAIIVIILSSVVPHILKARTKTQTPKPGPGQPAATPPKPAIPPYQIDLAGVPPSEGAAPKDTVGIFFCLDHSGSMGSKLKDQRKIDISKAAMRQVLNQINSFISTHPERKVKVGVCAFNSTVEIIQPLAPFDLAKLQRAIASMEPSGGTAIGGAIQTSLAELLKSKDETRAILVMTDGENTVGFPPDRVVQALKNNTNNQNILTADVEVFLVAFDVEGRVFDSVKSAGAIVVESRDQKSLESILGSLVEKVLLEKE